MWEESLISSFSQQRAYRLMSWCSKWPSCMYVCHWTAGTACFLSHCRRYCVCSHSSLLIGCSGGLREQRWQLVTSLWTSHYKFPGGCWVSMLSVSGSSSAAILGRELPSSSSSRTDAPILVQLGCPATTWAERREWREIGSQKLNSSACLEVYPSPYITQVGIKSRLPLTCTEILSHEVVNIYVQPWCTENGKEEEKRSSPDPSDHLATLISGWDHPSAASTEYRSSPVVQSLWEAWLGWLQRTRHIVQISHPRTETLGIVFLPCISFTMGGKQLFTVSGHQVKVKVSPTILSPPRNLTAQTEMTYSAWFCSDWGHVRPLPAHHSFFIWGTCKTWHSNVPTTH